MPRKLFLSFLTMLVCLPSCRKAPGTSERKMREPPAIVFVAFGTSAAKAAEVFDYIDSAAKARYPTHAVHWAFTSERIVKKIRKRGGEAKTLPEVIDELTRSGVTSVAFQSLHVVPGQKDTELRETDTKGLRAAFGAPLLASEEDMDRTILALASSIRDGVPNVVACHGNTKHPEFNKKLVEFAKKLRASHENIYACSVEGELGTDALGDAARAAKNAGSVNFIPFMIVAGVHIMDDVMGDDPRSWKNIVDAPETTVAKPLGYNDAILDIYFSHLDAALDALKLEATATPDGD